VRSILLTFSVTNCKTQFQFKTEISIVLCSVTFGKLVYIPVMESEVLAREILKNVSAQLETFYKYLGSPQSGDLDA